MSHESQLIFQLTIAIAIALVGGVIAYRFKQSPIIGYLGAGMLVGPFASGYAGDPQQIRFLADAGVIFLMFALGIEFSLKDLAKSKGPAVGGTLLQVALIMLAGTVAGRMLGHSLIESLFFGGIISVSSTMVILKNLMNRGELESNHGRLLLAMLIVQDLVVVLLILVLPRIATSTDGLGFELLWIGIKAVFFIGATVLLGWKGVPALMRRVEGFNSPELFLLTAVVLALGTASASALLGLSPALGAFMGGLMLTETEFDHRVISEVVPMRDLFATLFFVSIGMMIDIRYMATHLPLVIGMAFFIMAAKGVLTMVSLTPFRLGAKTTAFAGLGMIPIGEFNYVLAQEGLRVGAVTTATYNLILSSSLITIFLTPLAFFVAPRLSRAIERLPWLCVWLAPPRPLQSVLPTINDHAIVVGYGRVGKRMVRGLRQAGLTVVVVEHDLTLIRELSKDGIISVYGDASHETVLAAAYPHRARVIIVALPDFGATRAVVHRARLTNEGALIVARAQRAANEAKLRDAGATSVVVPEMAGALMLLDETLLLLGLPHDDILTGIPSLRAAQQAAHAGV